MTSEPILSVAGLNAWYGESHVLHGVDLDVHRGETVAILGRNGAGKTTTLSAIIGALRSRKGEIRFKGEDISAIPLHHVARRGLGFVPEERGIFADLSVHENLLLPPVIKQGGYSLEEIFVLFPNLRERLSSPGTKLSGGEQQMLAMARVLRTGVDVLLLDEPTEGLAPVIVQGIGAAISALKAKGMTVVLVEQNFRFARKMADRYYVMEDGKVIESFTAAQLPRRLNDLKQILGV